MSDIELVIKIPKDSYEATCNGCMLPPDVKNVVNAIRQGAVIPNGHGRLIDADELKKHKYHDNDRYENAVSIAQVDWQPTIIKADKAESEEEV